MIFFLIVIALILLALVIRFVQPELIYSLRQVVMNVRTNKAFLDYEEGRGDANTLFKEQLMNDLRLETYEHNEKYALDRALKIRELYRIMDLRRAPTPEAARTLKPQVCIIELANLLGNLGREVVPKIEYSQSLIKGQGLLAYIGNEIRKSNGEGPLTNEKEVENYFIENPISVEQAIEILIAAVFGLAYRQTAERLQYTEPKRTYYIDYWAAIGRVEKRLRLMVGTEFKRKYQSEESAYKRFNEVLGEDVFKDCLRRMEQTRKRSTGIALNFLDFLYLGQLEKLIFADWDVFRVVFLEKHWLKSRMEKIIPVRNEAAHSRPVSKADQNLVLGYCQEIEKRIDGLDKSRV